MYPVRSDLLIELGTEFSKTYTYIDGDGIAPDLSLWHALVAFKPYGDSPVPFFWLGDGSGITLGPNGSILLELTEAETAAIPLPDFMDWGQFPNEGTMTSPRDANVSGRLAAWELRLITADRSVSFIPLSGVACFRQGSTTGAP
jgi:hypothetical protein